MGRFIRLFGSASLAIAPLATAAAQGAAPFTIPTPSFATYAGTSVPLRLDITDSVTLRLLAVRTPSWESSDPSKAWITPEGVAVLLEPGRVKVRARMGNFVAERELDVRKANVRSLALRAKATASLGERVAVTAIATDDDERTMTGVHANIGVVGEGASIDDNGQFVSRMPGSYLVVAELGGKTTTQRIDVSPNAMRQQGSPASGGFEIVTPKFEPYAQTTLQLGTSMQSGTGDVVTWGVTDSAVARVSQSGMLELKKPGHVKVWAATRRTRAEREIKVLPNPAAEVALRIDAKNVRVGDAVHVTFDAWKRGSRPVENARVLYAVALTDAPTDGARVRDDGVFVARAPGVYTIIAALGDKADRQTITVRPR